MNHPNESFMIRAIEEAQKSALKGNYAVGSVLVCRNEILAVTHTSIRTLIDPTAHGEILAIREAAKKLNHFYIPDGYLYTTLEPCPMCTSAAIWAKLKGIVFGARTDDAKRVFLQRQGHTHDWRQIDIPSSYVIQKGTPKLELYPEFMRNECLELFSLNL